MRRRAGKFEKCGRLIAATAIILSTQSTEATAEKPASLSVRVPVYFASDRKLIGRKKEKNSAALDERLKLGTGNVLVPSIKEWSLGTETTTLRAELAAMDWTCQPIETKIPKIEKRGYVAEGAREKLVKWNYCTNDEFWNKLKTHASNSSLKRVYVYIPGFASSGINSIYAGGILASRVEAPVVVFSWPSNGTVSRSQFAHEKELIDDPRVQQHLVDFLDEANTRLKGVEFVLAAHSLGNRLLANYFERKPKPRFAKVYFISADLSKERFYKAVPSLKEQSQYTAVFQHERDGVLYASTASMFPDLEVERKLGLSKFAVEGIEYINYLAVAKPATKYLRIGLKHYLPFEHLGSIARTGQPYNGIPQDKTLIMVKESVIRAAD